MISIICTLSHVAILMSCSFLFLSVPWAILEKPAMMVAPNLRFDFWVFFTNALCALALNFSVFLVIGRTGAITVRVAGVLKDWILIGLSTILFPDSKLTVLNILGYTVGIYSTPSFAFITNCLLQSVLSWILT